MFERNEVAGLSAKERKAAEIEELRNAAEQESLSQVDQGKVEDELMVKQLELLNMREKEVSLASYLFGHR